MSAKRTATGTVKPDSKTTAAIQLIASLSNDEATLALVHAVDVGLTKLAEVLGTSAEKLSPLCKTETRWTPSVSALLFGIVAAVECLETGDYTTAIEELEEPLGIMALDGTYDPDPGDDTMLDAVHKECGVPETAALSADALGNIMDGAPDWLCPAVAAKVKELFPNSTFAAE